MESREQQVAQLEGATRAFGHLFSNDISEAREAFSAQDSPFHLLGLGVCAFLEAALGMETNLMSEATRCLSLADVGAKKQQRSAKPLKNPTRFPPGLEWEILHADTVILLGLTQALSESYMGYIQCIYALNNAHSKFTKLYKTVFPNGLDDMKTPSASAAPSRTPSTLSLQSLTSSATKSGIFGRWGGSTLSAPKVTEITPDGPIEELIVAGTSFGFGLFNLIFSLLPAKIRGVAGFFGFQHDRRLALQALAVSAAKSDVHSVFAGLALMTYYGAVLLLSGYQADETHILKQYRAVVENVEAQYPTGALWILNRAKMIRMSNDPESAIKVLQDGLKPDRSHSFAQADMLLLFELAWTLLAQRRYQESADIFLKITSLNSWSHATYYFIAAGCNISLKNYDRAQELFDAIPLLLEKRKLSGKDLPTEVLIKKKLAFYKQKSKRRGGTETRFVEIIKISPAEELAIFWNSHSRISNSIAHAHIEEWSALSPPVTIPSPYITPPSEKSPASDGPDDLDTLDELALRSLLLGITHRTAGQYETARAFLEESYALQPKVTTCTWIGSVTMFELAVLDLKEAEASEKDKEVDDTVAERSKAWTQVLKSASEKLDQALSLATSSVDLSSRLDSRINMLKDEIAMKRNMITSE